MNSVYKSELLNHDCSSTNIRVIEIMGRDEKNPEGLISCKFKTISLGEAPSYTALSYTWGPPDATKFILLNDEQFEVRINLWNFLNEAYTRKEERPYLPWIDAICIDQSNGTERNHQVAMMGKIYSTARNVLVWLGLATEATSFVLSHLSEIIIDSVNALDLYRDVLWSLMEEGVTELQENDYWKRLWILQEYLLAKEIELWCGTHSVSDFSLRWLFNQNRYIEGIDDPLSIRVLRCRHDRRFSIEKSGLEEMIDQFSYYMQCPDARDSIYALLSLVTEEDHENQFQPTK